MTIHCICQIISIGIILHVFRTDERFAHGSRLGAYSSLVQEGPLSIDQSFIFGVASAVVSGVTVVFLTATGMAARKLQYG